MGSLDDIGFPTFLGFFAGLITMTLVGSWLRLVLGLRKDVTHRRQILGIPVVAFAHPIPWLWLVAMPVAGYYFVLIKHSLAAAWFFGVWLVINVLWWIGALLAIRHFRKRQRNVNARPGGDGNAA